MANNKPRKPMKFRSPATKARWLKGGRKGVAVMIERLGKAAADPVARLKASARLRAQHGSAPVTLAKTPFDSIAAE